MDLETIQARIAALEATELLSLVNHREEVTGSASLDLVYQRFLGHPYEYVGVTDGGQLGGVTSRGKISFVLGSRYGFSLFARDPVSAYLLERPLALRSDLKLREVLAHALSRRDDEFFQDVAVVDEAGVYRGMVSVPTLVRLQDELSRYQTLLAEEQRASLREKAALRASEQRLRLALEAGRMDTWQIDADTGRLTWSTVAGENGWTEEMLPRSLAAFRAAVLPEDCSIPFDALARCQTEEKPFHVEYRIRHPGDGTVRWVESRGMPVYGPDECVMAVTGLSIDITTRKHAEAALQTAKEDAERANNAKNEFLSRMSHEFRTPLNAILGFGQLMEMDASTPGQKEGVGHVLRAGRHLLGLIDEVLDIARIETGRLQLETHRLDVRDCVQETLGLVRLLAERHGIRLDNCIDTDACDVLADRRRFQQILVNLLTNAIKYNRVGGTVTLHCRAVGSHDGRPATWCRVDVRDTGIGIAPESLGRLFAPFDRLGQEQKGVIEGTGIGLALSKSLAEAMGGRLGVESVLGVGSNFWVDLPVAVAEIEKTAPPVPGVGSGADDGAGAGSMRPAAPSVIYIEDNEPNVQLVERFLARRRGDFALLAAVNGPRGLELVRARRPHLVLLDLQLPGMSGEEVLCQLGTDRATRDIPVIVLSADATEVSRKRLLEAGACDYLCKPLNMEAFLEAVDRALTPALPLVKAA